MKDAFSKNLIRIRKERNLTQEKLAESLGVSFQAVSKWETMQSYPDTDLLPQLAELLSTDIDSLFGYIPVRKDKTTYHEKYKIDDYYWGTAPGNMCYDVMRLKPPVKPLRVLDICCGEGKDSVFFANNGYIVSAFDIAETGIEKGKRLAERNGVEVSFFTADVRDFIPDSEFDIIFCSGGLTFLNPYNHEQIMNSYKEKTADGGLNALNVFVEKPFIVHKPDSDKMERYWKSGELFTYYHDWYFHNCTEYIFDCNSSGVPHKHCMDTLIAEKIKPLMGN